MLKSLPLRQRFIIPVTLIVIAGVVTAAVWTMHQVRAEAARASLEKVQNDLQLAKTLIDKKYPGPWTIRDGYLYKGTAVMNNNFEVIDQIGQLIGGTCTIFQGDTRVATNVMKGGRRATGTKVSEEVRRVVVDGQRAYYGEADVLGVKCQTAYEPIKDGSGKVIGILYAGINKDWIDRMADDMAMVVLTNIGLSGTLAVFMIAACLWFTANSVVKPIRDVAAGACRIAAGDLTVRFTDTGRRDEVGRLTLACSKMVEDVGALVKAIRDQSASLASAAQQLSANAEETSAGANEISSAAEEVAATVVGMSEQVRQITGFAGDTAGFSQEGRKRIAEITQQIKRINEVTSQTRAVIEHLRRTSERIGMIVDSINNLADQTNLLALNAAIEAARAGGQGRGFAVVAEEVRKLAEQSARAAKEIRGLIGNIQVQTRDAAEAINVDLREAGKGVSLVSSVGELFQKIDFAVQELARRMESISEAAAAISASMENITGATQESTASTEEVASSAVSLARLASDLEALVQNFKLPR